MEFKETFRKIGSKIEACFYSPVSCEGCGQKLAKDFQNSLRYGINFKPIADASDSLLMTMAYRSRVSIKLYEDGSKGLLWTFYSIIGPNASGQFWGPECPPTFLDLCKRAGITEIKEPTGVISIEEINQRLLGEEQI